MIDKITGVILAGGKSSRFGANKALAELDGKKIIEHVTTALAPLFANRLLVTNTPADYAFLDWPMTADNYPGAGPLAGIQAALLASAEPRIFVAGCDMPLLNQDLIRHICGLEGEWDAVIPWLTAGPEPLCALYAKSALPVISAALGRGDYRVGGVLDSLQIKKIDQAEILQIASNLAMFSNINRMEDLATLPMVGDWNSGE